jgi:hypothetical protein
MYSIQSFLEIVMTGSTHRHSNLSVSDEFDGESHKVGHVQPPSTVLMEESGASTVPMEER